VIITTGGTGFVASSVVHWNTVPPGYHGLDASRLPLPFPVEALPTCQIFRVAAHIPIANFQANPSSIPCRVVPTALGDQTNGESRAACWDRTRHDNRFSQVEGLASG
jgi:hypothetical protein